MATAKKKTSARPDLGSIGGVLLAVGGILGGLILDGGKVNDVKQITAAMVVFGGTIGAVLLTTPLAAVMGAVRRLGAIFFDSAPPVAETIENIIGYAAQARKQGIVSLEQEAGAISDPFLSKALNLAVDGMELSQIRAIMELEIDLMEQRGEAEAKAFEAAGGYAPTIGIIGAVLGLMQVMKNLANIDEVGRGIAAAFVATVYGVGSANLFFLPAAGKLKARLKAAVQLRELMLEGVLSIVEGLNPKLIRIKLDAYIVQPDKKKSEKKTKAAADAKPARQAVAAGS
ncbi:MAG: flagellar motor protein [Bryobacteraceae bacterium]|jgi:chemotaxis protein MotA